MKKHLSALLIGVALLFPAVIAAQTDGTIGSDPQPPSDTPLEEPPKEEPSPAPSETSAPAEDPAGTETPSDTSGVPASDPTGSSVETAPSSAAPTEGATQPVVEPTPQPSVVGSDEDHLDIVPMMLLSEPVSFEASQGLVDAAATIAPPTLQPWVSALAGALGAIIALLGVQAAVKNTKRRGKTVCAQCSGSGYESAGGLCTGCSGTRMIEEEYEQAVECAHCKTEGEEPCEACEGTGETSGTPCGTCGGDGVEHDKEGEPLECTICRGEGETSVTLTREVPCPDCTDK